MLASRVVGRGVEIAALDDALERATGGQGSVDFLVGEPGIGKSRLAQVVAAQAAGRGVPVLSGRAVSSPAPLPYRPLAEALCGAVRSGVVSDDAPGLTLFRPILGWLVPEWRGNEPRVADSVMALAEAVLRLLRVAAGHRGCLVVLEDLHWADPETLRIVEYLADNLAAERVLCLATVRDERPSAGLELGRALQARRVSRLLELSRLGRQEVADMVGSCLGAETLPHEVLELAARADGVPFLVAELLAAAVTSGALDADGVTWARSNTVEPVVPLTFSDGMRRRLTALGEPSRAVLRAAAVLGRRFDWSLLSAIAGLGEEEVLAALRDAVDAQIVSVDRGDGTFRFRHALSRDAVMAELLPPERAALSRRALEAVEAIHPELEDERCELAAELAEGAGDGGRAGMLLLEVGRRSVARGALASAETALDRARRLLPADDPTRLDVDECLCQVLSHAGKRERALDVGASLLARLMGDQGATQRRAEVYLGLARAALAATHWDEAYALLEQARAETVKAPEERLAARVDALGAQMAMMREPEQVPRLAEAALQAAQRLGMPDVACEALEVLGRSQRRRDLAAAEAAFARALALAEAHGLTVWRARALHELGTLDLLRGSPVTRLEEARNLALVQGALATAAVVDVQIAAALAVRDDPEPAVAAARRAEELAGRYGLDQTLAAALALEAHAHARAGRAEQMQRCIQEALALAPGSPDVEVKTSFAAAVLGFLEEDRAAACRHLCTAVDRAQAGPGGDYSAVPAAGLLSLVRQLVDRTAGDAAEPGLARDSVHFIARGFHRYALAVAAGRGGDPGRAATLIAEGDRVLGDHQWLRYLGRRLLAEAALADGWGQPVPWLREALVFFDRRGEHRIASACRSLLRKAGSPVPRRRGEEDAPGPLRAAGITSRELEVLRLLALGLPNKEIATRLYLSPRTVERHIANIEVKAGVAHRSELVAFAARTLRA
jgi:DNA-binding CsgD family transcriptional regulator/tetratricopeptide (TPR) repeat protein